MWRARGGSDLISVQTRRLRLTARRDLSKSLQTKSSYSSRNHLVGTYYLSDMGSGFQKRAERAGSPSLSTPADSQTSRESCCSAVCSLNGSLRKMERGGRSVLSLANTSQTMTHALQPTTTDLGRSHSKPYLTQRHMYSVVCACTVVCRVDNDKS